MMDVAGRKIPFEFEIRPYEVAFRPKTIFKGLFYIRIGTNILPVVRD
jgi:hypothetical protein